MGYAFCEFILRMCIVRASKTTSLPSVTEDEIHMRAVAAKDPTETSCTALSLGNIFFNKFAVMQMSQRSRHTFRNKTSIQRCGPAIKWSEMYSK